MPIDNRLYLSLPAGAEIYAPSVGGGFLAKALMG